MSRFVLVYSVPETAKIRAILPSLWYNRAMLALATAIILSILPQTGEIAFLAHENGNTRLCIYDVASGAITEIGPGNQDREPRWSPDGSMLAFTTEVDGLRHIAIAHPDENRVEILNNGKALNQAPRWARSSKRLAYQSGQMPNTTISVYDIDANSETTWGGGARGLLRPVWTRAKGYIQTRFVSPPEDEVEDAFEGRFLAIVAVQLTQHSESGQWTTRIVAIDENYVFPLDDWIYDYPDGNYLEWSAEPGDDDRAIAYESNDGGDREIFIALGGKVFDVSNHRSADWNPVWSPDDKWVAYETFRDQRRAVYRSHRESGRSLSILESGAADFFEPAWHPDAQSLVALRDRNGIVEMVLVTIDGGERAILETPYTEVSAPQWRPR